jgi:hypothetical protein
VAGLFFLSLTTYRIRRLAYKSKSKKHGKPAFCQIGEYVLFKCTYKNTREGEAMAFFDFEEIVATTDAPAGAAQMAYEAALVPARIGEPVRPAPSQPAPVYLASEGIIQAFRDAARSDLVTIALPEAVMTLLKVMRDPTASAAARVNAAKTVVGVALADAPGAAVKKALHEMTAAEIEEALFLIRGEIDAREMTLAEAGAPHIDF